MKITNWNYGFKEDAKFCVASTGRCGSTMMSKFIVKQVGGDNFFGVHKRDFVEFDGKVIFMFGDPLNTVISTHNPKRGVNLKEHYRNFGSDYSDRKNWPLEDTLEVERLFDDWYRPHQFDMITVRYETLWGNLDKLSSFLELDFSTFPPRVPRLTNWHDHPKKDMLCHTYKSLINKIDSAEDIKIWK